MRAHTKLRSRHFESGSATMGPLIVRIASEGEVARNIRLRRVNRAKAAPIERFASGINRRALFPADSHLGISIRARRDVTVPSEVSLEIGAKASKPSFRQTQAQSNYTKIRVSIGGWFPRSRLYLISYMARINYSFNGSN